MQRIEKWDNLKFFLIYTVVLGHFFRSYSEMSLVRGLVLIIYSFHMPLFLFLSGLFSKHTIERKNFIRIFSYLLIFFFMRLIIQAANAGNGAAFRSPFSLRESGAPWYMFALFCYCLLTMVLRRLNGPAVLIALIALACIAGYSDAVGDFLILSRIIVFYPFFFAGYLLREEQVRAFSSKRSVFLFSLIFLLCLGGLFTFRLYNFYPFTYLITGRRPFSVFAAHAQAAADNGLFPFSSLSGRILPFSWLFRFLYYPYAALVSLAVMSLTPERFPIRSVPVWGSRSLQIYILHRPLVTILMETLGLAEALRRLPGTILWVFLLAWALTLFLCPKIWGTILRPLTNPEIWLLPILQQAKQKNNRDAA